MEWDDFYERAENWSKSTLCQRISSLKTIGEAWEISDIAEISKDQEVLSPRVHRELCEKNGFYEVDGEYKKIKSGKGKNTFKKAWTKKSVHERNTLSSDDCTEESGISLLPVLFGIVAFPVVLLFKILGLNSLLKLFRLSRLFAGKKPEKFYIGDPVLVKYSQTEGRIIDINGSLIMVSMYDGGKVDSYQAYELERI